MKRSIQIFVIFLVFFSIILFPGMSSEHMDVVVLLDTSESMFPFFDDTIRYVIDTVLNDYVRFEDQFHLLTFNSHPTIEITRKIMGPKDLEDILARVMLLQPFGKHTDIVYALKYLQKYVADLPLQNRKTILILTDGIHDPPPDSNFPAETPEEVENNRHEVEDVADAMRKDGWDVHLFRYPTDGEQERTTDIGTSDEAPAQEEVQEKTETDGNDMYAVISDTMDIPVREYDKSAVESSGNKAIGMPKVVFPGHLGKVTRKTRIPFTIINYSDHPILVKIERIVYDGIDILDQTVTQRIDTGEELQITAPVTLPKTPPGDSSIDITLVFGDDLRISPLSGTLMYTLTAGIPSMWIILYIGIAIAAVALIFLIVRFILARAKTTEEDYPPEAETATGEAEIRVGSARFTSVAISSASGLSKKVTAPIATTKADAKPVVTTTVEPIGRIQSGPQGRVEERRAPATVTSGIKDNTSVASIARADRASASMPSSQSVSTKELKPSTIDANKEKHAPVTGTGGIPDSPEKKMRPETIGLSKGEKLPQLRQARVTGDQPIEMIVVGQNHLIGFRNIHQIHTGQGLVIGGKKRSHYRIFLIPLAARIAELHRDKNGTYVFRPLDRGLFPDIPSSVPDCLNTYFRILSGDKELYFYFQEWKSPLEKLNKIMHIVDKPGKPDFSF